MHRLCRHKDVLKPHSTFCRECLMENFNLDDLDVSYSQQFQVDKRGPLTDICLDDVESRFLLAANTDGSLLIYDTQEASEPQAGISTFPHIVHLTTVHSSLLPQRLQNTNPSGMSSTLCLLWNPVDTGSFVNISLDKTLKIWDTNRAECVEVIDMPECMTWASMSPCALEHNLIAVSLQQKQERQAVLIDPLMGAPSLSFRGGHTNPVVSQVAWSARSSFTIITSGADGRILFWDIRVPIKPFVSLDSSFVAGSPLYSHTAVAHNGPVQSISQTPDGLHLFSWGSTGSPNTATLRMWSLDAASGGGYLCAADNQLRPVNFGTQPTSCVGFFDNATTDGDLLSLGARMAVGRYGAGRAWGGDGAAVFMPTGRSMFAALVTATSEQQRTVKRHFSKIRACVWNAARQEVYTAGLDNNLHTWILRPEYQLDDNNDSNCVKAAEVADSPRLEDAL